MCVKNQKNDLKGISFFLKKCWLIKKQQIYPANLVLPKTVIVCKLLFFFLSFLKNVIFIEKNLVQESNWNFLIGEFSIPYSEHFQRGKEKKFFFFSLSFIHWYLNIKKSIQLKKPNQGIYILRLNTLHI